MRRLSVIGLVCALAGLVLLPATASAQNTITLEGTVRNAEGGPIASAQVGVTNPETNERRAAQTNELGRFRLLGFAPGRYEVTVRAIGYEQRTEMVELLLGQRANLVFDLQRGGVQLAAVAVTADRMTTVEVQRTSVSTPVIREMIEDLPTIDRNIITLASVAPGVKGFAPSAGRALPSAGAMPDLRFNNFYLDGIELKSLFNGNLVGIPQTGAPLPQEAIQEFRVFLNPYDAEYSHAGSYVISAESNRGTNETSGSAFGYVQTADMVAKTFLQRRVNAALPDYNRTQLGANLRGPIQRDRWFYALNYEMTNTANYIDVNPGATVWDQYRGSFRAPNLNHNGFLRTTYSPSERNTIDGMWALRYMTGESNFGGTVAREGGIDQSYLINVGQIRHRYLPTPRLLNELSLQLVHWHHDEGQLVPGPQRTYPSITLGTATFPLGLNELHLRLINRASYTKDNWFGSHLFKGGVELSRIKADQFSPNFQQGNFRYPTNTSTQSDQVTIGVGFFDANSTADAKAELSGWITGLYVNDEWRPTQTLTLNLGLRWDAELNTLNNDFTVPWQNLPAAVDDYVNRGDRKNDLNNFSPRLSFSWDPFGTNRTFIRGGAGIIYDRVASFIGFQERLAASWRTYTIANPTTEDVSVLRSQVNPATATPNIILVKNKMEAPENRQLSLGFGHQASDNLAFNVDYIHQDVRHLYLRLNPNYRNAAAGNARALTSAYGDIILWDDFGKAKFDAVVLSTAYRRPRLMTNVSYTLGWYRADYDAVTAPAYPFRESYNMQRTAGDERHRFVLTEIAQVPFGIEVSGIATVASPRPYNASIGRDINQNNDFTDDFFANDDVPDGSPAGTRTIRPDNAWKNWYRNVDLRIGRSLFTAQHTRVSLSAEIFNVFNTNNTANYGGRMLDAAGTPLANFGQANTAFGARRAQVGMRAEF
jgi:hypothetical protein